MYHTTAYTSVGIMQRRQHGSATLALAPETANQTDLKEKRISITKKMLL
jgi:hypothetical protein